MISVINCYRATIYDFENTNSAVVSGIYVNVILNWETDQFQKTASVFRLITN